jgi:hypothetical protein
MMGRPSEEEEGGQRVRGTLQVLQIIKRYGLNAAIGVNNVGNAFTPQGTCDPLSLASLGVGLYQAATKADADLLLVSVITLLHFLNFCSGILLTILRSNVYQIELNWPWESVCRRRTTLS